MNEEKMNGEKMNVMAEILQIAKSAKAASKEVGKLSTEEKNKILFAMAEGISENKKAILEANKKDLEAARAKGTKESLLDRLELNEARINSMCESLREVAGLKDCVGEIIEEKTLYNGLKLQEKRVGFGVIGIIYESRPNVTTDVCGLCLKSSSAVVLKGGSDALNSNKAIVAALQKACPIENAFQLVESTDRAAVENLLQLEEYIDLVIPRGGAGLISFVRENSKIPVIETGTGNCHIYVDDGADIGQAVKIIANAKAQRPGVCNAVETVLVHKAIAKELLPKLAEALEACGVEIRGCEETSRLISCNKATEADWKTEFLDLILAVKVVGSVSEAIAHINTYGTKHSEAILTPSRENIQKFFAEVDAAAVYSNASTRFTDGGEFGLGMEIGISTQKMHARGPMGLKALTTTKYLVTGGGQVRE